jgi:hypothetical protein
MYEINIKMRIELFGVIIIEDLNLHIISNQIFKNFLIVDKISIWKMIF